MLEYGISLNGESLICCLMLKRKRTSVLFCYGYYMNLWNACMTEHALALHEISDLSTGNLLTSLIFIY